jgi:hypothetical protein
MCSASQTPAPSMRYRPPNLRARRQSRAHSPALFIAPVSRTPGIASAWQRIGERLHDAGYCSPRIAITRTAEPGPFKDWICEQLREDPTIQAQRLRELAPELGYGGGKTISDDFVRDPSGVPGQADVPADGLSAGAWPCQPRAADEVCDTVLPAVEATGETHQRLN